MSSFDTGGGFDGGYWFDDAGQPIPVERVTVQARVLTVTAQPRVLTVEVQAR